MKILKIKFKNINSLKGEHEIDFSKQPFSSGSLFAITGPTGSGKSTILDVISLALFNQIPRLEKISKSELTKTGAVITKNQTEASAEVSYDCNAGKFTSKWFIAYNRNNKLNDYGMELSEFETGKILDFKKSEVPSQNESLIGLNYDQFIKSVVLAQGEFAQFLKEKKDKRAELLEKITGTGIYRALGMAAFEKYKSVSESIKVKQAEISAISNNLLEEEAFEQIKKQLSQQQTELTSIEQVIKKLEAQISIKQNIFSHEQEINILHEKTAERKVNLDEFQKQYGDRIQRHEKLQPYADPLRLWNSKYERLHEIAVELKKFKSKAEENGANGEIILQKAKTLSKKDLKPSNLVAEIEEFYEKVTELQQQKTEKRQEYTHTIDQLNRELKGIDFQFDPQNAEKSLADLKAIQSSKTTALQALEAEMKGIDTQQLPNARRELQERINAIIHAKQDSQQVKEIKDSITQLQRKYEAVKIESAKLPALISSTEQEIALSSEKLQRLMTDKENKQLKAQLHELRLQLVDNEPCPLCGATEHPYAGEEEQQVDELSMQIEKQQQALDQQKESRTNHKNSLKLLAEQLEKLEEEKKLQTENLSKKQADLKLYTQQLDLESTSTINWVALKASTQAQLESIDSIQALREQTEALAAAIPLHGRLNRILIEGRALDKKFKEWYTGDNINQDRRSIISAWQANQQEKESFQERTQELSKGVHKLENEIEMLQADLMKSLAAIGFDDISEAQSALLSDVQYRELRDEREQYQKQLDAGLEQLQLLKKQLEALKKQDPEEALATIQIELTAQDEKKTALQKDLDELRSKIKTQENYLQQLEVLKISIAQTEKKNLKWKLLKELIGDSTGNKFNDFAQDLSLSQLIILANKRLKDLSDRYMLDKADLATEDDSLVAIDAHMGGQRRSVKTLSGGETFILSLSMALALSDLASRNVTINSLFIDEGFGTLDPETLDQTLDTLEKLQAESSKTIGIISHVDSLKERISTQIKLSRNGQGYSKIDVVG